MKLICKLVHAWEPDIIFDEGRLAHFLCDSFQRKPTRHDLASRATILHSPTIVKINMIITNILQRSKSVEFDVPNDTNQEAKLIHVLCSLDDDSLIDVALLNTAMRSPFLLENFYSPQRRSKLTATEANCQWRAPVLLTTRTIVTHHCIKHVIKALFEDLRDRPGSLPTPFVIALAEVAAESIPTTAAVNVLDSVIMDRVHSQRDSVRYTINTHDTVL
jgi:hypothetical protein